MTSTQQLSARRDDAVVYIFSASVAKATVAIATSFIPSATEFDDDKLAWQITRSFAGAACCIKGTTSSAQSLQTRTDHMLPT